MCQWRKTEGIWNRSWKEASSLLLHLSNGLELLREIVLMYVMIERDGKKVYWNWPSWKRGRSGQWREEGTLVSLISFNESVPQQLYSQFIITSDPKSHPISYPPTMDTCEWEERWRMREENEREGDPNHCKEWPFLRKSSLLFLPFPSWRWPLSFPLLPFTLSLFLPLC